MINKTKRNIIGVQVDAVNYKVAADQIIEAAHQKSVYGVTALAVHGVMTGVLDEEHRYRLNNLHLVCPDGQPVRWAINLLYKDKLADRVYGPNLTLKVCERAAAENLPIYLYGSKPDVVNKLTENLKEMFPSIIFAGYSASKFRQVSREEQVEINQRIKESGAAITIVGLGCPRQEVWAYENMNDLSMPVLAVGAAFDFHAGTLKQAPQWVQNWGLEWFFRFIQEPNRLWRRYVYLNPYYLMLLFLQATRLKKFPPPESQPVQNLYYG